MKKIYPQSGRKLSNISPKHGRKNRSKSVFKITAPPTDELEVYGKETTLHGLKYVFQSDRHACEKIFWTISFVSGIVIAGFLIYGVCISYLKNPVVVTYQVEETKISNIPFPAVTLCNTNRVRKSVATDIIKSVREATGLNSGNEKELEEMNEKLRVGLKQVKCIDYTCQVPQSLGSPENVEEQGSLYETLVRELVDDGVSIPSDVDIEQSEVDELRLIAGHPCDEFAVYCKWRNKEYNCSEFFSFLHTDEGMCCVFNKVPAASTDADLDNMYNNAARETSWGMDYSNLEYALGKTKYDSTVRTLIKNIGKIRTQKRGGRSEGMSIVLNPDLEESYCSSFTSPGFVFKTHHPVDTPQILEHSTPIPPSTEVYVSLTPSVIFADIKDIKWFTISNRRCYFTDEYQLSTFKTYTKENCNVECEAEYLEQKCGCRLAVINLSRNNSCGPDEDFCVTSAMKEMATKPVIELCPHCLSTCNELDYIENVVLSPMSHMNSKYHTGFQREYYSKWMDKNMSILHVYFEDDSFYARERKQLYSLTDLIGLDKANIGGLLGLCLGFSGLSLVEVGYFFCIRPCFKRRGNAVPAERSSPVEFENP